MTNEEAITKYPTTEIGTNGTKGNNSDKKQKAQQNIGKRITIIREQLKGRVSYNFVVS